MPTSSPTKKTIELQANTSTPHGATIRLTVEYRIRPPVSSESGPIYEGVQIHQHVDANMGHKGQYEKRANYTYENERDRSPKQSKYSPIERTTDSQQAHIVQQDEVYVPEKVIEHISEDEKSTSSEEVVFEEWTEEFSCRRTDEFDRKTNQLLRTTIDETSDRIKGDVLKEQYKGKNTRIKGHKSYDVIKEIHRRVPARVYEEIPKPPPTSSITPRDRQWTSEDIYTTEIVQDPTIARELESTAQKFDSITHYDRVRPSQTSPIPTTIQTTISTYPSTRYDRISNVVTPTVHYADKRKQEKPPPEEEFVSEEYQVEVETTATPKPDQTSGDNLAETYITNDPQSPTRRDSDWRNKYRQIYNPNSDDDQYKDSTYGNYLAQRVSVIPSSTQQRFKEVQIRLPGRDRTPPEQRKFEPSPPSRHTVKEVLVRVSRSPSPEKPYHPSLTDDHEHKRKKTFFLDPESPKKVSSTSPTDDDQPRSSSFVTEHRTQYETPYSRVGELKNAFETTAATTTTTTTAYGSTRDDLAKYKTPISTGFTEQRRRIFEDQEWNRRPINEFQSHERRISETHTAPSLVSDRISRIETTPSTTDHLTRTGFDTTKTPTSVDIKYRSKQLISSLDSDLSGPTQPIYQSTPKSYKVKRDDDAGHESEDELSDPKQNYDTRRRTSKTRLRDFSQSTQQLIDVTHTVHRATSTIDNVYTQIPTTKGKSTFTEPSPPSPSKSHFTSDSGVFDYSTTATSQQFPTSSPTWRHNVSTTIIGDTPRSRENGLYVDTTITSSPYGRRQTSDTDETTIQNVDDSLSRSTYRYDREIIPNQYQQQQQRTVRRHLTNSPPTDYEHLTSYQSRLDTHSKVPITTQSRTIKPLVVDEYETVETKTQVDCQVQRTNEIKESTTTERVASPSKKILTITTTATTATHSPDEAPPARRVLLNERPQYFESPKDDRRFQPIQHDHSLDDMPYRPSPYSHTMEVTSLSPTNQIKFGKNSPNEIIAVVRVPELSKSSIRHGTSDSNLYEKSRGEEEERPRLNYQRVHAASYRPPLLPPVYQQRQSRLRYGPFENANDYSSPITIPNLKLKLKKRPPRQPQQPTSVTLDQGSRAIVTTSKDGRVSVQNIAAYPGNTVVINSDFHSSDRSLNRSSGYFSSDEPRSQGHTGNYSSDEQSSGAHRTSPLTSSPLRQYRTNEHIPITNGTRYRFDRVNEIVQNYSRSPNNFNDAIDQIDALYTNLDVQTNNQRPYDFSKLNRRRQLTQNPNEYSNRYTSTGFQQMSYEQPTSSLTNLAMATPIRPSQSLSSSGILTDYGTPGSISPRSTYSSTQNLIVQQNRLNGQSQIVQRNRTSVKQMKQKNAAKRRNGNIQGLYSDGDDDDENDSPLSDSGRFQPSSRSYNYYQ